MALRLQAPVNAARGERLLAVGDYEVVLAGEHDDLARLDAAFETTGGMFGFSQRAYRLQIGAEEVLEALLALAHWPGDEPPSRAELVAAVRQEGLIPLSKQLADYVFLAVNGVNSDPGEDDDEEEPPGKQTAA